MPNIVEYVLGSGALNGTNTKSPTGSVVGSNLEFRFSRTDISESDTTLVVEWSNDLIAWHPIAIGATTTGMVQIEERGADADLVTVSIPLANSLQGRLLARLKVVKP